MSDRVKFIGQELSGVIQRHIAEMEAGRRAVADAEIDFEDQTKSLREKISELSETHRKSRAAAMVRFQAAREAYHSTVIAAKDALKLEDGAWEFSPAVMSFIRPGSNVVAAPIAPLDDVAKSK